MGLAVLVHATGIRGHSIIYRAGLFLSAGP